MEVKVNLVIYRDFPHKNLFFKRLKLTGEVNVFTLNISVSERPGMSAKEKPSNGGLVLT